MDPQISIPEAPASSIALQKHLAIYLPIISSEEGNDRRISSRSLPSPAGD